MVRSLVELLAWGGQVVVSDRRSGGVVVRPLCSVCSRKVVTKVSVRDRLCGMCSRRFLHDKKHSRERAGCK